MKKYLSLILLAAVSFGFAQNKSVQVKRATVGFLNVENLWDTIPSADYIDGTLPKNNPKFHRSISFKFSSAANHYKSHLRISNISTLESIPIRYF